MDKKDLNRWFSPLRTIFIYAIVGSLWILLSDQLLNLLVSDQGTILMLSMYKGWAYVLITAALLYLLMSRDYGIILSLNQDLFNKNKELTGNYDEIRALYEELAASEETLHQNYDELNLYKDRLEEQTDRYRLVLMASQEGFWDYHPVTDHFELSKKACDLTGLHTTIPSTKTDFLNSIHPLDRQKAAAFLNGAEISPSGEFSADVRFLNREGIYRWCRIKGIATFNEGHAPVRFTGAIENIHEQMLQQEKIEHYAFHDPATGFYNRDYLLERLNTRLEQEFFPFPLLVFNIADFHHTSSIYGKSVADIVHYQMGMTVKSAFSFISDCGMLAPGKYCAALHSAAEMDAYEALLSEALEELSTTLKDPIRYSNLELPVRLGIGATYCRQHVSPEELLQQAEFACESSPNDKGALLIQWFTPKMYERKIYLGKIEGSLKKAQLTQELFMMFQPQYRSLDERKPIGYEALIRWNHPDFGMVRPDVFIPLAEEIGEILPIGQFVIESTCQFIKALNAHQSTKTPVSINASFKELIHNEYVDFLIKTLDTHQISPTQLCIEITETAISAYIGDVINNLQRLSDAGFEIHLDDFGTGYSSLNHLAILPIHVIKIDRSFTLGLTTNEKMRHLTDLIIRMGHQLDLKIIAEGVETKEQYDILNSLGCDYYQGYLLGKPMEAHQILSPEDDR